MLGCLTTTWDKYLEKNNKQSSDFDAICFIISKLGLKGLNIVRRNDDIMKIIKRF